MCPLILQNSKHLRSISFVFIFILLGTKFYSQNLPCITTTNSGGAGFADNNLSAVFALGEVMTGSSSNQNNYVVLSIIRPDGKLITNIRDIQNSNIKVKIFPNPVLSHIQLESETEIISFRILNSYGQVVSEGITNARNEIDVSDLLQGMYLLQVSLKGIGNHTVSWIAKIDNN